jgi:GNAT superfamily N-acetyltransferase
MPDRLEMASMQLALPEVGMADPAGAPPPAPARPPDPRTRALEFQRALDESLATRVEPTPWGAAIFRDDLPRAVDLNLLRVDSADSALDAAALTAEADNFQSGLPHRAVRVPDPAHAAAVAPGFGASGWLVRRTAVMVQRRFADRPGDAAAVEELPIDRLHAAREAFIRHEHRDLDVGAEVLAAGELPVDGVAPRAFGAIVATEVVAYCMLRTLGRVAKITEAEALSRSSGRGAGRAVIAHAAQAARHAGASLVFVESADEDWAKWTYHRMGFDEVGKLHLFVRPWGE